MTHPLSLSSHDLSNLEDCRRLVGEFYARVREDALLASVFVARIAPDAWPTHLERMAGFWYTVLFGAPLYHGDPVQSHRGLPIEQAHFARWLGLWASSVDQLFSGPYAEQAKARAARMARVLSARVPQVAPPACVTGCGCSSE